MRRTLLIVAAAVILSTGCTQQPKLPLELSGNWTVQQVAGASLGEGVRISLHVDAASGAVNGFTGCRTFTAPMTAFGQTVQIGTPATQAGECANAAAATDEARFLGVIASIRRFARQGKSLELLSDKAGSEALLRLRFDDT